MQRRPATNSEFSIVHARARASAMFIFGAWGRMGEGEGEGDGRMSDKANPEYRAARFFANASSVTRRSSVSGRRAGERARFQRAPLCRAGLERDNGPEMKLRFDAGHF